MLPEKRFEILNALPAYGPMYVPVTGNEEPLYSEGFPVRFFKTDGTDWVANFQPGWTDLKQILELDETQNLLVIAGGACYLMDPNNTNPVQVFGVGYCDFFKADNGRLVLQDQTDLTILEPDGRHWHTERISWDGFKEIKIEHSIVSGLTLDPMYDADEWVPFTYDLDTQILTGGSYHRYDNRKPWWQFWKK